MGFLRKAASCAALRAEYNNVMNPLPNSEEKKDGSQINLDFSKMPYWKIFLSFALGLMVGVGSAWMWFDVREQTLAQEPEEEAKEIGEGGATNKQKQETTLPSVHAPRDRKLIISANQAPGVEISIAELSLPEEGWVVIYEDRGGVPGNALGARRFDSGVYAYISVGVLRPTLPGGLYYAVIHSDDGDKQFNLDNDFPVRDEEGAPFMIPFRTTTVGTAG